MTIYASEGRHRLVLRTISRKGTHVCTEGSGADVCMPCPCAVPEARWEFLVLLPLFDPPRPDTKSTIEQCIAKGISVKMVTGARQPCTPADWACLGTAGPSLAS